MKQNFEKQVLPEEMEKSVPDLDYQLDRIDDDLYELLKNGEIEEEDRRRFNTSRNMIDALEDKDMQAKEKQVLLNQWRALVKEKRQL